jgi:YHS domain-containing protein
MKRLFLAVVVVASAAFIVRAQQDNKPAKASETTQATNVKKAKAVVADYTPQASEYGKKEKCPVSGEEFKVSADTKAVKYKGKTYYFCCGGCLPQFKKHPAKFAK